MILDGGGGRRREEDEDDDDDVAVVGMLSNLPQLQLAVTVFAGGILVLWVVRRQWRIYAFQRYLKDHPYTIVLDTAKDNNNSNNSIKLAWFLPIVRWIIHIMWTLLSIAVFGSCAAVSQVLWISMTFAWKGIQTLRGVLAGKLSNNNVDSTSSTTNDDKSIFVLAPTSTRKGSKLRTAATTQSSLQQQSSHRVSFAEHSNGQVKHTEFKYDPNTLQGPATVQESQTPPRHPLDGSRVNNNSNNSTVPSKARIPQTPPLNRNKRRPPQQEHLQSQMQQQPQQQQQPPSAQKENDVHKRKSKVYSIPRRPTHDNSAVVAMTSTGMVTDPTTATTPTPSSTSLTSVSSAEVTNKRGIPSFPTDLLEENRRKKRRASHDHHHSTSSVSEFSPAVKRMYGRLRLPTSNSTTSSTNAALPLQQRLWVSENKLKRRRQHEQLVWEAFHTSNTRQKTESVTTTHGYSNGIQNQRSSSSSSSSMPTTQPTFQFGATPTEPVNPPNPTFGAANGRSNPPVSFQASNNDAATPSTACGTPSLDAGGVGPAFQFGGEGPGATSTTNLAQSSQSTFRFGAVPTTTNTTPPAMPDHGMPSTTAAEATPAGNHAPAPISTPIFQFGSTASSSTSEAAPYPSASFGATPTNSVPVPGTDNGSNSFTSSTFQTPTAAVEFRQSTGAVLKQGSQFGPTSGALTPTPAPAFQFGADSSNSTTSGAPTNSGVTAFQSTLNSNTFATGSHLPSSTSSTAFQFGTETTSKTTIAPPNRDVATPSFQFGAAATTTAPGPLPASNPFAATSSSSALSPPPNFQTMVGSMQSGSGTTAFNVGASSSGRSSRSSTPGVGVRRRGMSQRRSR